MSFEVPKNWLSFFATVVSVESFINKQQVIYHNKLAVLKKTIPVDQVTKNDLSSNKNMAVCKNSQAQSQSLSRYKSYNSCVGYSKSRAFNKSILTGETNIKSKLGNHNINMYYNCNKISHWSKNCPNLIPKKLVVMSNISVPVTNSKNDLKKRSFAQN